jgi:acetyl esterase/lipase
MLACWLILSRLLLGQEILTLPPPPFDQRIAYGSGDQQFGHLRLPPGKGPHPVMVVIHGGYWRARYPLDYAGHLSAALTRRGFATWNIEYRRVGQPGGGYPGTLEDVRAAVAHVGKVAATHGLDARRVYAIGHSAGGHLALWLATQGLVRGVVALSAVTDLEEGARRNMGNGAVEAFMGCPLAACVESYRQASPAAKLPARVPLLLVHGENDTVVPIDQAEAFVKAAQAKQDEARLIRLPGAGHFELVDPRTKEWKQVEEAAVSLLR